MSAPTKIGVIGDVHCEHQSLVLAIETLKSVGVESIICTGDLPTGPGQINACCDLLRRNRIATIRGNHDRWLLDLMVTSLPFATPANSLTKSSWRFLESLPVTLDVQTSDGLALLCHGIGSEDMLSIFPEQPDSDLDEHPILLEIANSGRYRWIINGHSHRRMVRHFHSLTIINAGTLRRDHAPCFAAINFERGSVTFWEILHETAVSDPYDLALYQTWAPGDERPSTE